MLGKKMVSLRKLAKKKKIDPNNSNNYYNQSLLGEEAIEEEDHQKCTNNSSKTPTGCLAVYVGEERRRFVVPTGYLSHPLFKMLLEKARDQFGFEHAAGVAVPCTVAAFREIVAAVECSNGGFDFRAIVDEFL